MKAILMTAAGDASVLQMAELAMPELPSPHHLRVRLAAAGVNPLDTKLRAKPAYYPDKLPAILGCDGAGVVEAVGAAVTRFKVGDAVYFCNGGLGDTQPGSAGNYAEYVVVHEEYAAAAPASIPLSDAAALPLVCLTAWEALFERARLQAGQTLLIHAAAGGVGHIALQLAHSIGAQIAVTVSDTRKGGLAQALGASRIINYRERDFVAETLDWTAGRGADVVFDTVGGETFLRSLKAARIGGTLVSILATPLAQADVQLARLRNLSLGFELMLTPQVLDMHEERIRQRKILEQCAQRVDAGELGVLVTHRLPLEQASAAHRLIEAGGMTGKVVLMMD
ncbi:MAG: zinc-dependent alcohol dehydrogenase family protein [Gallionella sp.]|nr:zinc-dependent alcohol dehydrogenase family protein [Gallionella sp.]MDD4947257.1 zinc-dependent alcohol dehydrogenase family protein [Gallionella sp.]MDD5611653.1 zinc-dependent alcohol dehydrogenase family protein [Gallionella sp.]